MPLTEPPPWLASLSKFKRFDPRGRVDIARELPTGARAFEGRLTMLTTIRRSRGIDLCHGADAACHERTGLVAQACEDIFLSSTLAELDGCCNDSSGPAAGDCAEAVRERYRSQLRSCIERS
jgi:hypothetical protein